MSQELEDSSAVRGHSTEVQVPTSEKTLTDTSSSRVSTGDLGPLVLTRKVRLTGHGIGSSREVRLIQQESGTLCICMCSSLTAAVKGSSCLRWCVSNNGVKVLSLSSHKK